MSWLDQNLSRHNISHSWWCYRFFWPAVPKVSYSESKAMFAYTSNLGLHRVHSESFTPRCLYCHGGAKKTKAVKCVLTNRYCLDADRKHVYILHHLA